MLEILNLTKSFGEKVLIEDLSFSLKRNEKAVIFAPSGSGKTTLFRMICGIEKPDRGKIIIGGTTLNSKTIYEVRNKIAFSGELYADTKTVEQTLDEIFSYSANKDKSYDKFLDLAETLNLTPDIYEKTMDSLSAGERKRLSLIIAVLLDRELMLIDEPIANLDSAARGIVIDLINKLDKTMLIVSHDSGFENLREVQICPNPK